MSDTIEVLRGREASAVLENEAFKQAMTALKKNVHDEWMACPIRDREGQLLLLQLAKLTEKFEGLLVGMIKTGEFAKHRIDLDRERDESGAERVRRKVFG
jgi:hypothetical protein